MSNLLEHKLYLMIALSAIYGLLPMYSHAQNNDSLRSALVLNELSDSNKVKVLIDIADAYKDINADSDIFYAKQGLAIAEKINFQDGIAGCRQKLGTAFLTLNDFENALLNYNMALEHYLKTSNIKGQAIIYQQLGNLQFQKFKYDSALYYYNVSITLNKQIHNNRDIGLVTMNTASIYTDRGLFSKALDTYEAAMWSLKMEKDNKGIELCLGNIATLYINMGDYNKATDYNKQCMELAERINDKLGVLASIANESIIYSALNDNIRGLAALKRQYSLADSMGNVYWKNIALVNMGNSYITLNMPDSAMSAYHQGLLSAEKTHDNDVISAINLGIGSILNKQGNTREAIKHLLIAYEIVKSKQQHT